MKTDKLIPELLIKVHNNWYLTRIHFFPGGSDGKESTCDDGDLGSIPES